MNAMKIRNRKLFTGIAISVMMAFIFALFYKTIGYYYFVNDDRIKRTAIICGILIQGGILLYLLCNGRLPDHIITCYDFQCILTVLGFLLALPEKEHIIYSDNQINRVSYIFGGIILLLTLVSINKAYVSIVSYRNSLSVYEEVKGYLSDNTDNAYFSSLGTINSGKKFTIRDDKDEINWFGTYGWSSKSPWYEAGFSRLGLDSNGDLLLQDKVFFMTKDLTYADALNSYFLSKDKISEDYSIYDELSLSDGTVIYVIKWHEIGN